MQDEGLSDKEGHNKLCTNFKFDRKYSKEYKFKSNEFIKGRGLDPNEPKLLQGKFDTQSISE